MWPHIGAMNRTRDCDGTVLGSRKTPATADRAEILYRQRKGPLENKRIPPSIKTPVTEEENPRLMEKSGIGAKRKQGTSRTTPTWDFPGGPVAKTLSSQSRGYRFYPWSGN